MKIKELIEYLQGIEDQDRIVIMSKDGEGNAYSPFCGDHSVGWYEPESTWSGDVHSEEDIQDGFGIDENGNPVGEPCIVLWPIN